MIEIDGTFGEGGGQILRTSLALAALTGQSVHITRIRGGRRKPGLMRQHLTCVKAAAEITGGVLTGAELNSQELTFTPGKIRSGAYRFAVGSAGSTLLIAQTVIPVLLHGDGVSHVAIEGGTHCEKAPLWEFFRDVYLAALRKMGAEVAAELESVGFYPAGGGRIVLDIAPVKRWKPFVCMERGRLLESALTAMGSGIDEKILEDEIRLCRKQLPGVDFRTKRLNADSPGPGNALFARLDSENITELFGVCGSFGVSRSQVSERVAGMVKKYLSTPAPVGRYLADQLLLPMALGAGGRFLTLPVSQHTTTNSEVIRRFLDVGIGIANNENGTFTIEVKK